MNKSAVAIIGMFALLIACKSEEKKETPNGLQFTVVKSGDGVLPKKEEVLVFDWELKDSKDSVWGETFKEGVPAASLIADSSAIASEDGMTQMFRMLSGGDSVKVDMPVTEFFSKVVGSPVPPQIDSTLSVTYTIKVRGVMVPEEYMQLREDAIKKREARILTEDTETIRQHLAEGNMKALQDTSGLQYIIHTSGGGKKPTVDNCVEVKYKGRFLKTGETFDEAQHIAFPLNGVITGWKLGIPMLGEGDSATFFIPSKLAYGPQGYPGAIPPDAILIFDVTLLEVKDEFDQATRSCK